VLKVGRWGLGVGALGFGFVVWGFVERGGLKLQNERCRHKQRTHTGDACGGKGRYTCNQGLKDAGISKGRTQETRVWGEGRVEEGRVVGEGGVWVRKDRRWQRRGHP
jgi:hypothetical protein